MSRENGEAFVPAFMVAAFAASGTPIRRDACVVVTM